MMNIKFIKSGLVVALGMVVIVTLVHAATPVRLKDPGNKHNLSNWGPGPIKAAGTTLKDTEVCIYCHAPHNADSTVVPLWGHKDTAFIGYSMAKSYYVKPNATGVDAQPTGISKKCLSCHDGTIAIGALISGNIAMTDGVTDRLNADGTLKGPGTGQPHDHDQYPGFIGTDLRGGHVISFVYNDLFPNYTSAAKLISRANMSAADNKSMFDGEGKMQCHSCHDPHTDWCTEIDDATPGTVGRDPLWRKPCTTPEGRNSSVCEVCHKNTFSGYTQGTKW